MGTTIFAEMSALATTTGSVNLGQGFPDTDGPREIAAAAARAIMEGRGNQYPPGPGISELRQAIAAHQKRFYGIDLDPDGQVLVTAGATEAIAAALLALLEPGDEAIAFEPYYDSYAACVAMAGATRVPVTLRPPDFRPDLDALRAAITSRTRLILLNSPHNPTGVVFTPGRARPDRRSRLRARPAGGLRRGLRAHGLRRACTCPSFRCPGMAERTVTISSAAKTFSFTGWKIGWVTGSPELVTAVRTVKQFLTYVTGGPFQYAIAEALALPDSYYASVSGRPAGQAGLLLPGAGRGRVRGVPAGRDLLHHHRRAPDSATRDGMEFCRELPRRAGVVAIPSVGLLRQPRGGPVAGAVRVLQEAGGPGRGAGPAGPGGPGRRLATAWPGRMAG